MIKSLQSLRLFNQKLIIRYTDLADTFLHYVNIFILSVMSLDEACAGDEETTEGEDVDMPPTDMPPTQEDVDMLPDDESCTGVVGNQL